MLAISTPAAATPAADPHPRLLPGPDRDGCLSALVEAAAAGDDRAWRALVARFDGLLRDLARSYRLNDADAGDVAQEAWLQLVQHISRLEAPAAVGAWLATTTRRTALRALQRGTREVPSPTSGDADAPDPSDPADGLVAVERRAAVHGAVRRLPARQRVVVEALLEEPPGGYAEVAQRLGTAIGALGPTRARALDRLRLDAVLAATVGEPA